MDGCSLVARKEGVSKGRIRFLSFWNDLNDELVVFSEDRTVTFFSIEGKTTTADESSTYVDRVLKELKEQQLHKLNYGFDFNEDCLFDCYTIGSTMWIADEKKKYAHSIQVTRITKEECQQVKMRKSMFRFIFLDRIRIGKDVVTAESLKPIMPQRNETFLLNVIDFEDKSFQRNPIVIKGACVALNGFGKYMLIWQSDEADQSHLNLYSKDLQKLDVSKPILCLELGSGVLGVEATSLDRQSWTSNEKTDASPHKLPLICVFKIKHSKAEILLWDTEPNKVLARIDVTAREVGAFKYI